MLSTMNMKVERTLTSKKGIVLYYTATGNTKSLLYLFSEDKYDFINMRTTDKLKLNEYNTIVMATSTWGQGIPPKPFLKFKNEILSLKDKRIALFGSGRLEYQHFCGALDILEEMTKNNNEIVFKYKFEGYPRKKDFDKMKELARQL